MLKWEIIVILLEKAVDNGSDTMLGVEGQGSWRDQLSLRAAKASAVFYGIGTVIIFVAIHGWFQRLTMTAIASICFVVQCFIALTGRPKGRLRAWFVVVPAIVTSIAGFGLVGFLAGPAALLTVTITFSGLLLGRRAMVLLLAVIVPAIALIGWAMVHTIIPVPDAEDVSLLRGAPWVRSMAIVFLAVSLLGSLLVDIVSRLETSLEHAKQETRLREEAQKARVQAEKAVAVNKQFETIGQLAAGVAHDFNNNLVAIIGSAELMKEDFRANRITPDLLDDILSSAQRAAQLTRQLLVFSRKAKMVLAPTDVHQLIEHTVALLRRSIDPKIEVATHLAATDACVLADATLLDNALLNLLVNARDAMPKGGKLTVATSSYEVFSASHEHKRGLSPGAYILLEVLDTGEGIAEEILPNIFDPFFTTKEVGKGTGLGLATVSGTIKSLKGSISVETERGCGTAFRILLPCERQTCSGVAREAPQIISGSGHILLVDDDAMVCRTAVSTLKSLGYEVTVASNGINALEVFESSPDTFSLVILDLRMPLMDGAETYDMLRNLGAKLPIVIWSGYGGDVDVEAMLRNGATRFIQKPYGIAELSKVVYEAIYGESKNSSVADAS